MVLRVSRFVGVMMDLSVIRAIMFRVPFLTGGLNLGEGAASSASSFGAATARVLVCACVCACSCVRI
jgi:hypothetical protein